MLEEHRIVKGVEQGRVKDEKCLFLGLEIWEKRKEKPSRSQDGGACFRHAVLLVSVQPGDMCMTENATVRAQLSAGMPNLRCFSRFRDINPPLMSLEVWGQRGQAAPTLSPCAPL